MNQNIFEGRGMKFVAIAVAVWAIASGAQAQDWVLGGNNDSQGQLYDQDGIRKSAAIWTAPLLHVWQVTQHPEDGSPFDYALFDVEFDCAEGRFRTLSTRMFRFGNDRPVGSDEAAGDWTSLPPGTLGRMTRDAVCADARQAGYGFSSPHEAAIEVRAALGLPSE